MLETTKVKKHKLEEQKRRIRDEIWTQVDQLTRPPTEVEAKLLEKLKTYLDVELCAALATLRGPVKHSIDLDLSDDEIDNLTKVHCALIMSQPMHLSKEAKLKIYEQLGGHEFRVLVLKQAPNKYHPLIASLQKRPFPDQGPISYAALSYSWGEWSADHHIYLLPEGKSSIEDSVSQLIWKNLFCALHRLRREDRDVVLWVDALCIDQTNEQEKTGQLRRMVEIYNQAKVVCVWLGESDDDGKSDEAMKFIPQVVDMAMLKTNTNDKNHARQWEALSYLIRDPWFTRRWIVQEISLAKEAVVYCGENRVHWDALVDAIVFLVASEERVRQLFNPFEWRNGRNTLGEVQSSSANILLGVISNLFATTENGLGHHPLKSLEYLVTTLQTFDATDPHDLIYALVHVSSDHREGKIVFGPQKELDEKLEPLLYIDYENKASTLFMRFTKFCVETSHSLDIICRPWAKRDESQGRTSHSKTFTESLFGQRSLPSWIPLLENAEFGGPGQFHKGRKNGRSFVGSVNEPIYHASDDKTVEHFMLDEETMTMSVEGLRLGTVNEVSAWSRGLVFQESLKLGGWEGTGNGCEKVPAQIWRTLVADRTSDGLRAPLWYQRACFRSLELAELFNGGDLTTGKLSTEVALVREYAKRVQEVTWNRCFFTANRCDDEKLDGPDFVKPWFGLCPMGTSKDDEVCILLGCSVPVILRPLGDGAFKLIGEAYVHGVMNGEFFKGNDQNKRSRLIERIHVR